MAFAFALTIGAAGIILLGWNTSWWAPLGVVLLLWGNNLSQAIVRGYRPDQDDEDQT